MLTYSYKVFSKKDINTSNIFPANDKLETIDHIDLSNLDRRFYSKRDIIKKYNDIYDAYLETTYESIPALFKDFMVKEPIYMSNKVFYIYTFTIIDSTNNFDGEDNRVLECGIYDYDSRSFANRGESGYTRILTFKIKLQHVWQARVNLKRNINALNNNEIINKYVIPIYINTDSDESDIFTRFSDEYADDDMKMYRDILSIHNALERFIFANTYVWYNLNTENRFNTTVKSYDKTEKKILTRSELMSEAKSDKKLIIRLDNGEKIDLVIHTNYKNMYSGTSRSLQRFCQYKYQVIGHYQHYWIGKGRKTRVLKWVEPYYKNKDKEFKIIKEYR